MISRIICGFFYSLQADVHGEAREDGYWITGANIDLLDQLDGWSGMQLLMLKCGHLAQEDADCVWFIDTNPLFFHYTFVYFP